MALPLPNLPAGCVQVSFQANIEGYPQTSRTIAPRIVNKLLQYMSVAYHQDINGAIVQGFPGLTEMFEYVVLTHLIGPVEMKYPDAVPPEVAAAEAALAAAKAAALPKFI